MGKKTSASIACVGNPKIRKPRQLKKECKEKDAPVGNEALESTDLLQSVAATSGIEIKDVKAVFDALPDAIAASLRQCRKVSIPRVINLKLKDTKSKPEVEKHLCGKIIIIPAKAASVRVHPLILKPLKLAVIAKE